MCTHPFAKEALTLHLARSEGHERYFSCNLMHRKVLASSHQHLMAEAPYTEHKYCGEDDLFGSGHPPDTVVALAMAYHAFKTGRRPGDYGITI